MRLGGEYQLLKMNDSAVFYYEKLAKLNSLTDEVLGFQASSFSNLAGIYQKDTTILNHYEKAVEFAEKAIAIHKKRKNRLSQASAINNLAWAMRNLKEYEAYDYQEISYDMQTGLRDDEMTQNIKRITSEYNVDVVRKEGKIQKQKAENLTLYSQIGRAHV